MTQSNRHTVSSYSQCSTKSPICIYASAAIRQVKWLRWLQAIWWNREMEYQNAHIARRVWCWCCAYHRIRSRDQIGRILRCDLRVKMYFESNALRFQKTLYVGIWAGIDVLSWASLGRSFSRSQPELEVSPSNEDRRYHCVFLIPPSSFMCELQP